MEGSLSAPALFKKRPNVVPPRTQSSSSPLQCKVAQQAAQCVRGGVRRYVWGMVGRVVAGVAMAAAFIVWGEATVEGGGSEV